MQGFRNIAAVAHVYINCSSVCKLYSLFCYQHSVTVNSVATVESRQVDMEDVAERERRVTRAEEQVVRSARTVYALSQQVTQFHDELGRFNLRSADDRKKVFNIGIWINFFLCFLEVWLLCLAQNSWHVQLLSKKARLRSSTSSLLDVRLSQCVTVGDQSFATAGPRLWNSLPADVRSASSLTTFRRNLKTHLFRQSYPDIVL